MQLMHELWSWTLRSEWEWESECVWCVCGVCVCVLVFSTGIPEWSCWRKINFMLTFMFLWICTDVSEQERNGSGAVCLWPEVIWALNIRASVIRFLSKCGKVQQRRVCELGRTMFNRFSFMFCLWIVLLEMV